MEQLHDPQSDNLRPEVSGSCPKALRTIHRTAVRGIRVSTNSSHTLTASETLALDSTDYVGAFLFHGNNFDKYLFDGGYVTYSRVTGTGPVDPLVQRIAMVKRKNDNDEVNRMEF